jgi:hypothetical protein
MTTTTRKALALGLLVVFFLEFYLFRVGLHFIASVLFALVASALVGLVFTLADSLDAERR